MKVINFLSLLRTLIFSSLFVSFFCGCKKSNDFVLKGNFQNDEKIINKFLSVRDDAPEFIKAIVSDLRKREKQNPFIVATAIKNGFPNWEKAVGSFSGIGINKKSNNLISKYDNAVNDFNLNSGIAYIPLLDTLTNEVKSYVFCLKRSDSSYAYNTYNKASIIESQKTGNAIQKSADNVILGIHLFFEKIINGKSISAISPSTKGYGYKDVNLSFGKKENESIGGIVSNSIQVKVIPFPTICLEFIGSIVVAFTRNDGSTFNVTYNYYQPCSTQNVLPEVIVHSSTNNNGGGGTSLDFGSLLPNGYGNLFSGVNWAQTNTGNTNGGTYTGGGAYLEDPSQPFWGNTQIPENIRKAEFLARMIFLGNSPSSIAYLSSDDLLMTTIENALHRGGFSETIISAANKVLVALEQNKISGSYVSGLLEEFLQSSGDFEDLVALDIMIEAIQDGVANDEFISEDFFNLKIQPRLPNELTQPLPLTFLKFYLEKAVQFSLLKQQNDLLPISSRLPNWRLGLKVYSEIFHTAFDLIGLVPFGGEIFDIANGVLYKLEGDNTNALLSTLAAVPVAGYASSTVKLIKNFNKIIAVKNANGLFRIHRKSQTAFNRALNVNVGQIAHHLIPFHSRVQENPLMQLAFRAGFDPNDAVQNGKAIAKELNSGNHNLYANKIETAMNDILIANPNLTPTQAKQKLMELTTRIVNAIENSPGVHVDYLNF